MKQLTLVVPLMAGLLAPASVFADTWSDKSGKFQIEAEFLSVSNGHVYLEKEDGSRIAVPIDRLSAASLDQAKRLYQAAMSKGAAEPSVPAAAANLSAGASAGTSKLGANPTAKETAAVMSMAIAEFDLATIWDSLPKKHQNDVEEVVRLAATTVNEQDWNSVASLFKKVGQLAKEKKDFFFNNQMIGGFIPNTPETNQIWDASVELLAAYSESSLLDQSAMRNFSMQQVIANDVPKMRSAYQNLHQLTETMQDSPFGQMAEVPKIEIVSETASEAVVKFSKGGDTQEETFTKVDNRWVPKQMAAEWDQEIQKAKDGLAQLATPEGQQGMAQMRMGLMMVSAPLDQMLGAQTQADFDAVIGNLAGMAMGMMGGLGGPGGPGGGPPPGFGGPPPGFGGPPPGFGGGEEAFPFGDEPAAPAAAGDGF